MLATRGRWQVQEVLGAIQIMDHAIVYVQRNYPQDCATIDLLAAAELLAICEIENIELARLTDADEVTSTASQPLKGDNGPGHLDV